MPPITTFHGLNDNACLQLTRDDYEITVTFLQVAVCVITPINKYAI